MWAPNKAALIRGRHLSEARCLLEEIRYFKISYPIKFEYADVIMSISIRGRVYSLISFGLYN